MKHLEIYKNKIPINLQHKVKIETYELLFYKIRNLF